MKLFRHSCLIKGDLLFPGALKFCLSATWLTLILTHTMPDLIRSKRLLQTQKETTLKSRGGIIDIDNVRFIPTRKDLLSHVSVKRVRAHI